MSIARDVLFMVAVGLQQGKIKAPDIEMLLSDGPKRVSMLEMVMRALETLPQPVTGRDAEEVPEPERIPRTPLSAHPALRAANEWSELVADWDRLPVGTRVYYEALLGVDAAWERLAAACGVPHTASRAFAIADEAMYTDLRSYGVWNDQRCYVDEGMYAGDHLAEAVEWLLPRGYLEAGEDDRGKYVRVLRKPSSADASGVAESGQTTFSRSDVDGGSAG